MTDSARRTWISVLVAVGSVIGGVISSFTFNVTVPTIPEPVLSRIEHVEDLVGRYRLDIKSTIKEQETYLLKRALQEDYTNRQHLQDWVETLIAKRATTPEEETRLRILEHQSKECVDDSNKVTDELKSLSSGLDKLERRVYLLEKEYSALYNKELERRRNRAPESDSGVSHETIETVLY